MALVVRSSTRWRAAGVMTGPMSVSLALPGPTLIFSASFFSAAISGSAASPTTTAAVVVGDAAEPLIAALKKEAEKIKVGPGSAKDTDMGPVITPAARQRVLDLTTSAIDAGAVAIVDGRDVTVKGYENGFFVGPTILDNVSTDMH